MFFINFIRFLSLILVVLTITNTNVNVNNTSIINNSKNEAVNNNQNETIDEDEEERKRLKEIFEVSFPNYIAIDLKGNILRNNASRIYMKEEKEDVIYATDEEGRVIYKDDTFILILKESDTNKSRKLLFDKKRLVKGTKEYIASDGKTYTINNNFVIDVDEENKSIETIKVIDGIKYIYDNNGELVKNDTYEFANGDKYLTDINGKVIENEGLYTFLKATYDENGEIVNTKNVTTYVGKNGKVKYVEFFKYKDNYYFADGNGYLFRNRHNNLNNYFDQNCEYRMVDDFIFDSVYNDCFISYLTDGDDIRVIESEFGSINELIKVYNNRNKNRLIEIDNDNYLLVEVDRDRYINMFLSRYGRFLDYSSYGTQYQEKLDKSLDEANNKLNSDNPLSSVDIYQPEDSGKSAIWYGPGSATLFDKKGRPIMSATLTEEFIDENFEGSVKERVKKDFLYMEVDMFVLYDETETEYALKDRFFTFDKKDHKGINYKYGMVYFDENGYQAKNKIITKENKNRNRTYIYLANKDGIILRDIKLTEEVIDSNFSSKLKAEIKEKYLDKYIDLNGEIVDVYEFQLIPIEQ